MLKLLLSFTSYKNYYQIIVIKINSTKFKYSYALLNIKIVFIFI